MFKALPAVIGCLVLVAGCNQQKVAEPKLDNEKNKASYTIGVQMGMQLAPQKDELDMDSIMLGFNHAFNDSELKMTQEDMQTTMQSFQQTLMAKQQAKMKEAGDKNAKEGEAFLAENKNKEGVTTLDSGLQYKVLKSGDGESPTAEDTVVTHYRGTLVNGEEFDSSYNRGQPVTFPVSGVIKGWTEALQKMKVGDKWELYVPPELAYGERGAGPKIGPNSVLVFEVELLDIKKDK